MKVLIFSFFISISALAQVPTTDIFLFNIERKEGIYSIKKPVKINPRSGYNNQPIFSLDNKNILYVSSDSTQQTDVFEYSISKKTTLHLTNTEVSEYSPTITPDGKAFTCVVVEKDSTQRVWRYDFKSNTSTLVSDLTDSVGYYTWLNKDTLLYYKLTEPHSLRALNIASNADVWICNSPTRAFKKINNSTFIYATKTNDKTEFRIYNPTLRESNLYCTLNFVCEDFVWHQELGLIVSDNNVLKRYNNQSKEWLTLFSFSEFGVNRITRFSFDSKTKQLVIVNNL